MAEQPQTDAYAAPDGTLTERTLHGLVRDAVSRLSQAPINSAPEFGDHIRFELGSDGHFRGQKTRIGTLWPMLNDEWLRSLPNYQTCVECLESDVVV